MTIKFSIAAALVFLAAASCAWCVDFTSVNDRVGRANATSASNSTGVTFGHVSGTGATAWGYTSYKIKAIPDCVKNSTGDCTSFALPTSGTVAIYDTAYGTQYPAANQTISGTINLASPAPVLIEGPMNGIYLLPSNLSDNRTVSYEVFGVKK